MIVIVFLYGLFLVGAIANLVLMRRPQGSSPVCFEVMIPARNEAATLPRLIHQLVASGVKVTVFDDESSDGTGDIASRLGATVVVPSAPMPDGWTGKTNACHQLSLLASSEWTVFLDADTIPSSDFASKLSAFLAEAPPDLEVISGFARMIPGRGLEPAYLGWVPWIILCSNPFGLVARTGKGHNRFLNGQFSAWRTDTLLEVRPYEQLRGEVLEDVKIGRLLARLGRRVEMVDMTNILSVQMYDTLGEAVNGMSKNSAHIAGSSLGSLAFAVFFLVLAWGWAFCGHWLLLALGMFLLSKVVIDRAIRYPFWTVFYMPLTMTAAALTIVRSMVWQRQKRIAWKGRFYG